MTHLWKYRGKPLLFPLLLFCQLHHYQENNGDTSKNLCEKNSMNG